MSKWEVGGHDLLLSCQLRWRRLALHRQAPAVAAFLSERFASTHTSGTAPTPVSTTIPATIPAVADPRAGGGIFREAVMRGWLFYPLSPLSPLSPPSPSGSPGRPSIQLPANLAPELNPAHLRGWWTRDFSAALRAFPDSLWAVPGSGHVCDFSGGGGSKLHWMAPARAVAALSARIETLEKSNL